MVSAELIFHYFPEISSKQKQQFKELYSLYEFWNNQINVISRKDFDFFYERHVLHSLAIAKVILFVPKTKILDVGTGGGFPGIPLAILFPECSFHLCDSIGKKVKVVDEVSKALQLKNVTTSHSRVEEIDEKFDFVVSRAVTAMPIFLTWIQQKIEKKNRNTLKNGVLYLKGGDLTEEMKEVKQKVVYHDIANFFSEDFFQTKKVVYLSL
jgi:16S rRNA (guanine527-N7)-methyltransferase